MPPTTPHKRVKIPDGTPQWPDAEIALVEVLQPMLDELEPPGYSCVVPPPNFTEMVENGTAVVTVQRVGGNADRIFDRPRLHISVTTAQRSDSWDVLGWLRPQLHQFSGVVDLPGGKTALISDIEDGNGPQRTPALTNDTRTVNTMLQAVMRLER